MAITQDIAGFEGLYQVTTDGKIITSTGKELKMEKINGQYRVTLFNKGKKTKKYVASIVADTFLEKPSTTKAFILHKDGDNYNNQVDNLMYLSTKAKPKIMQTKITEYGKKLKLNENTKTVYEFDIKGCLIGVWDSTTQVCMGRENMYADIMTKRLDSDYHLPYCGSFWSYKLKNNTFRHCGSEVCSFISEELEVVDHRRTTAPASWNPRINTIKDLM